MTAPDAAVQARTLRDAAAFITGCAESSLAIHDANGATIATLRPALARPIAAVLLGAALSIEAAGSAVGLPVRNALEIAGLVMHTDLGHRDRPSDRDRGTT